MLLSLRCWRNVHLLSSFFILISLLRPCDECFIVCSLLFLFHVSYVSIVGKMQDGNMENNQTKGNLLSLWALTAGLFPLFKPDPLSLLVPSINQTCVFSVLSLLILSAASSECITITWLSGRSLFCLILSGTGFILELLCSYKDVQGMFHGFETMGKDVVVEILSFQMEAISICSDLSKHWSQVSI